MKQIRSIARNTYRLLFRSASGWGMIGIALLVSVFVFWQARGDNILEHELRLRVRYGIGFGVVFLSLGTLFFSCLSIRADLDAKVLHMLSSCPLPRYRVWLGKWLGLLLFSATGLAVVFLGVGASATLLGMRYAARGGKGAALDPGFWRCYRVAQPVLPSLDELAQKEYDKRKAEGLLQSGAPKWQVLRDLREQVRRHEQLLKPNSLRSWEFDLGKKPIHGTFIILEFRLLAQNHRQTITGDWRVEAIDAAGRMIVPVKVYPYTTHQLKLPAAIVPPSGRIRITFAGAHTPWLLFPRGKAVRVLVDDGSLWWNLARLLVVLLLHFGAVIATGLTLATVLTFPVASFASVVFFVLAVASGFFQGVVQELARSAPSLPRALSLGAIRLGLWLTRGLSLPPVLARFSDGLAVRFSDLAVPWGLGLLLFMVLVSGAGMLWLTRKELDRIH